MRHESTGEAIGRRRTDRPVLFQFSMRLLLAALTASAAFLALVRITDLPSAILFLLFVGWLLTPVLFTFGSLYLELKGVSWSRWRRQRLAQQRLRQQTEPKASE